jgi:hypothetical protein
MRFSATQPGVFTLSEAAYDDRSAVFTMAIGVPSEKERLGAQGQRLLR